MLQAEGKIREAGIALQAGRKIREAGIALQAGKINRIYRKIKAENDRSAIEVCSSVVFSFFYFRLDRKENTSGIYPGKKFSKYFTKEKIKRKSAQKQTA